MLGAGLLLLLPHACTPPPAPAVEAPESSPNGDEGKDDAFTTDKLGEARAAMGREDDGHRRQHRQVVPQARRERHLTRQEACSCGEPIGAIAILVGLC